MIEAQMVLNVLVSADNGRWICSGATIASGAALSTQPRQLVDRYSSSPAGKVTRKIVP
jgi:hypothetical protein